MERVSLVVILDNCRLVRDEQSPAPRARPERARTPWRTPRLRPQSLAEVLVWCTCTRAHGWRNSMKRQFRDFGCLLLGVRPFIASC